MPNDQTPPPAALVQDVVQAEDLEEATAIAMPILASLEQQRLELEASLESVEGQLNSSTRRERTSPEEYQAWRERAEAAQRHMGRRLESVSRALTRLNTALEQKRTVERRRHGTEVTHLRAVFNAAQVWLIAPGEDTARTLREAVEAARAAGAAGVTGHTPGGTSVSTGDRL